MSAKLKTNNGLRPLAVGTALRRLTATAIHNTHKHEIHKATGKHQYGVGRQNGGDQLYKLVQQRYNEQPTHTIISAHDINKHRTYSDRLCNLMSMGSQPQT